MVLSSVRVKGGNKNIAKSNSADARILKKMTKYVSINIRHGNCSTFKIHC